MLANPAAENPDAQLSCKLVVIMAEAGLKVLANGRVDPFFPREQLISQAIDSSKIIELIIRKNPELLLERESPSQHDTPHPRLFLFLLPRILSVLGCEKSEALTPSLGWLLLSLLRISTQTIDLWQNALTISQLYQACVNGKPESSSTIIKLIFLSAILEAWERLAPTIDSSSAYKVTLPPAQSISKICGESDQLLTMPKGYQIEVSSPSQALLIGMTLLSILSTPHGLRGGSELTAMSCASLRGWATHSMFRFWRRLKHWASLSQMSEILKPMLLLNLRNFSDLCLAESVDLRHMSQYKMTILHPILADFLQLCTKVEIDHEIQLELTKTLTKLLVQSDQALDMAQGSLATITTSVLGVASIEERQQPLTGELQVRCPLCNPRLQISLS